MHEEKLIRKRPLLSSRKRTRREKVKAGLKRSRPKRNHLKRNRLKRRKGRARNLKKLKKKARRNELCPC